jgi:hypothetical protein
MSGCSFDFMQAIREKCGSDDVTTVGFFHPYVVSPVRFVVPRHDLLQCCNFHEPDKDCSRQNLLQLNGLLGLYPCVKTTKEPWICLATLLLSLIPIGVGVPTPKVLQCWRRWGACTVVRCECHALEVQVRLVPLDLVAQWQFAFLSCHHHVLRKW